MINDKEKQTMKKRFKTLDEWPEKNKLQCFLNANNDLQPHQVCLGSTEKFKFQCDQCSHLFKTKLNNITSSKNPTWCHYCAGIVCGSNECNVCAPCCYIALLPITLWRVRWLLPKVICVAGVIWSVVMRPKIPAQKWVLRFICLQKSKGCPKTQIWHIFGMNRLHRTVLSYLIWGTDLILFGFLESRVKFSP